jgi:hypothetical protein
LLRGGVAGEIGFGLREFGETEIQNLHAPLAGHENVFGLQVAVNDSLLVGRSQSAGDVLAVVNRFAGGKSAVAQAVAESLAL